METTGILQHMMVCCMATVLQYYIDGLPRRSAVENFHFVFSTAAAAAAALSPTAATIATTAATNIPHTSSKSSFAAWLGQQRYQDWLRSTSV